MMPNAMMRCEGLEREVILISRLAIDVSIQSTTGGPRDLRGPCPSVNRGQRRLALRWALARRSYYAHAGRRRAVLSVCAPRYARRDRHSGHRLRDLLFAETAARDAHRADPADNCAA